MTPKARELETLALSMFASVPLYFTHAIGVIPLLVFHVFMTLTMVRVAAGKGPELLPAKLMRVLAFIYVPFYFVDWMMMRSTVVASTHLVLFIAAYQPVESTQRNNQAQRLLTAALIFTASVATSTHLTVVFFVIAFAFLMFRQLMYVSHMETIRSLERPYSEQPAGRTALFYLAGATAIAAMLFPMLPRVRNPFVQGLAGALPGATTGLSETINFSEERTANPGDATVVARVWMDLQTRPFFTPLRLRGNIYDRYDGNEWKQTFRGLRQMPMRDGTFTIARPQGVSRSAVVQLRPQRGKLFLPVGTYEIAGANTLYEGPTRETYHTYDRGMLSLDVSMAYNPEPLRLVRPQLSGYPISPEVGALARRIVGNEQRPAQRAALIEEYLFRNYRYLPNNAAPARPVALDQFLLVRREGHCEYFAAGMVALLNAVDVPARIAGGFYGGRFNPLTGYYAIRREDAHAWTEVWDGTRWLTFDATPASLRPGAEAGSALRVYLTAVTDAVTFFWDRYVLTFGLSDQITLLADMLTWGRTQLAALRSGLSLNPRDLADPRFMLTLAGLVAAGIAVILLSRRRRRSFDLLAAVLKERGIDVGRSMTMEEALRRLDPESARALAPLIALYEEEEFSGQRDPARRRTLRRGLASLQ